MFRISNVYEAWVRMQAFEGSQCQKLIKKSTVEIRYVGRSDSLKIVSFEKMIVYL